MVEGINFNIIEYPNGLRLAYARTPTDTIFASLKVFRGALHENQGEEGLAHFLEHMVMNGGTRKYTPREQDQIKGKLGFSNAFTSKLATQYIGGFNSEDLDDFLDLYKDMVFHPRFDDNSLKQQKQIILREISRKRGDPSFEDSRFYLEELTRNKDHDYFVLGDENVIDRCTPKKLRNFHSAGYNPNNSLLILTGDLPLDLVDRIGEQFSGIEKGKGMPYEVSKVSKLDKRSFIHTSAKDLLDKSNPDKSGSFLRLGVPVPDEFHEDNMSLKTAAEILGRSRTYGIHKRIRNDEGLAYNIGCYSFGSKGFEEFCVTGKILAKRQQDAIDISFEELKKMKGKKLPQDEINRAKRRLKYRFNSSVSGSFRSFLEVDPLNISLLMEIDNELNENKISKLEKLRQLEKVDANSILEATRKHLPSDRDDNYVLLLRDPLK